MAKYKRNAKNGVISKKKKNITAIVFRLLGDLGQMLLFFFNPLQIPGPLARDFSHEISVRKKSTFWNLKPSTSDIGTTS